MVNNNQGLLNKIVSESETDRSMPKILTLAFIGIVFSFFFGYFLRLFILNTSNWEFLLFCFLAAVGFLIIFLLDVFFVKTFWIINLIIFLESLTFLAAFYNRLTIALAMAALAGFLIFIWGQYAGRQELENMLKIKFWQVSKKALPKAISALALFASVAYAGTITFSEKELFISRSTFDSLIAPVGQMEFIKRLLPGFDFSATTGEFINNLARNQIEQRPEVKLLPKAVKDQLLYQATEDLKKQISELIGEPINPKIKVSEMLYNSIANKFNKLPANVKTFIPIGIAILVFLVIVGLALPIRWLVTVLAFLIYETCLALGFGVIMLESRSREIIVLK